jgi:ribokinase
LVSSGVNFPHTLCVKREKTKEKFPLLFFLIKLFLLGKEKVWMERNNGSPAIYMENIINHKDVIGFGALNTDLIYEVESIESLRTVFPLVESGGEYFVDADDKFSSLQALLKTVGKLKVQSGGGQSANTVVALARMGFKTGFIGKVGCDAYGDFLLHELNGVDTSGIVREGKSGICLIVVDNSRERTNFVIPNCNDTLNEAEIDLSYIANSTFLHLSSFVGAKPFKTQKKIVESIPPNVKVSFDPGELYSRKGLKELLPIVNRTYIMFLTEREILYLLGLDYHQGSKELLNCGPSIVVCKRGSEGSIVFTKAEIIEMPAQKVQAVDATGAGDVYAAGFLAGLLVGTDIEECASFATKVASHSVTGFGREKYPDVEYRRAHFGL